MGVLRQERRLTKRASWMPSAVLWFHKCLEGISVAITGREQAGWRHSCYGSSLSTT